VQLEEEPAPAAAPPADPIPTEVATPTAPPAPTDNAEAAGGAAAGTNIEELARRLFDPLSARIRAELWLDRERSGLVTDFRP
jgi:hypothetical protein